MEESDKTVFQPAVRSGADAGSVRPVPGGRANGKSPRAQAAPARAAPEISSVPENFSVGRGLNPLINAASALIAVMEKTRGSASHSDIGGLHRRLVSEIKAFEQNLRDISVRPEIVLSARYIICSALDENVLNTPWGSSSPWAQRTLLSVFHNETSGGEKFFMILDRMRQAPADNLHMIELMYLCLSLGFEGKYRLSARGRDALEQIRDDLFAIIRRQRGEYERSLADRWQGLGFSRKTLAEYFPMWVIATIVVSLLFFTYTGFRWWLHKSSAPVVGELHEINMATEQELTPVSESTKNEINVSAMEG